MLVKQRMRKPGTMEIAQKPLFRFDPNGEFVTEDEKLIEKLKPRFRYEETAEVMPETPVEVMLEVEKPVKRRKPATRRKRRKTA